MNLKKRIEKLEKLEKISDEFIIELVENTELADEKQNDLIYLYFPEDLYLKLKEEKFEKRFK